MSLLAAPTEIVVAAAVAAVAAELADADAAACRDSPETVLQSQNPQSDSKPAPSSL